MIKTSTVRRDIKLLKLLKRYEPKQIAHRLKISINIVYDARDRARKFTEHYQPPEMSKIVKTYANLI